MEIFTYTETMVTYPSDAIKDMSLTNLNNICFKSIKFTYGC